MAAMAARAVHETQMGLVRRQVFLLFLGHFGERAVTFNAGGIDDGFVVINDNFLLVFFFMAPFAGDFFVLVHGGQRRTAAEPGGIGGGIRCAGTEQAERGNSDRRDAAK